ncbi:MAG: hypothetical protein Q8L34_01675 [Candidatus Woesearchaeota archaeon]|nr:hypothetical protein [Candidatus Woesearchaeota archaeon]
MTLRNKFGKTLATGLLALVAACDNKTPTAPSMTPQASGRHWAGASLDTHDRLERNYPGFTLTDTAPSTPIDGFHEVYKTNTDQYIVQLAASSYLVDAKGKLLTEGGHVIENRGGILFTGYGTDIHRAHGINVDLLNQIFEEHKDLFTAMRSKDITTELNARSQFYRLRSDKYPRQSNTTEYIDMMGIAQFINEGRVEKKDDGVYVKFQQK